MSVILATLNTIPTYARDPVYRSENDVIWSDDCSAGPSNSPGTDATSDGGGATADCKGEPLPDSVPEYWRNLINAAAEKHPDTDRRLVAATLWTENRGWPDPKKEWATSPAGASGPWQFIPSSWQSMGEDGNSDGVKNANDPEDAVHGAFNHLKGTACKPILEGATGNAEEDFNNVPFVRDGNNTLMSALANYNGRGAVDGTPLATNSNGENGKYLRMTYWLLATDFQQSVNVDTGNGEKVDATTAGSPNASADPEAVKEAVAENSSACANESKSESSSVVVDGYAFPLNIPKPDISNGYTWPCPGICHHDGTSAFDLSRQAQDDTSENAPVVAITSGTIEAFNNSYSGVTGCQSFQLKGNDGYYYWYGHLQGSTIQDGSTVGAGEQISTVGRRACTGNGSYPHLHIDRGNKGTRGGSVGNRDAGMVDLINKLYEAL